MSLRSLALVAALSIAACGGKNPGSYETLGKTAKSVDESARDAAEELWSQRGDLDKLKQAIAAYERLAEANPNDRFVLARVTRGWYFLADAWIDDADLQIETYLKAIEWGKRCMAINQDFAQQINAGTKEKDAASTLTKDDIECTYWTASSLGKWAKASGIAKSIKHLGTVKAYVGRVEELDPTYFHHAPARYWGAYYSVIPSFAGRDLEKSRAYFEDTLKGSPGYLGSRVLRAENLAVGLQDVKMFDDDLKFVLAFDVKSVPALEPENTREQVKARKIQAERASLFDKKALCAAGE
jgi:tetratricopeptide (TPR) repeat protein